MRLLQIGGGSMGSRRMRDLPGLTVGEEKVEVRLLDGRADRRDLARIRFGLESFERLDDALAWDPEIFVISTPPDRHADLLRLAVERRRPVFCEADIWAPEPAVIDTAERTQVLAAPSATLLFHPVIREVARVVAEELGTAHCFGYVLSVDASSWHPDEGPEYYARQRATAPAREMTAFELIALQDIVGQATTVSGALTRRGGVVPEDETVYALQYVATSGAVGQLTTLMASPQVARRGWVAGDNGMVFFDLNAGTVSRQLPALELHDERRVFDPGGLEAVYLEEISTFLRALEGGVSWPYTLRDCALVSATVAAAEISALTGRREAVHPDLRPAQLPDGYRITGR